MLEEYPVISALGQSVCGVNSDAAIRWASSQCTALIVHASEDVKMGTIRKLFGNEGIEHRPAELAFIGAGKLVGMEDRLLDAMVPRDVWRRLLMCTLLPCSRVTMCQSSTGGRVVVTACGSSVTSPIRVFL
jgi:hypothetical protein